MKKYIKKYLSNCYMGGWEDYKDGIFKCYFMILNKHVLKVKIDSLLYKLIFSL